uniref:NADH-ubiquinone oxidoreductase chain 6 n=1 Tax=Nephroselmis olivacea TaxID=31312 RepID=Q9TC91_NEPOL|nr:NADH dehydrogenase subunit 6 [Nephroselmis olivacea]AAF03206.1 NADH dehydrogenase subunit 6 [Nephroselmis olivacea]
MFSIFSSLAIICGILVIRAKNPVHSVLFLILVFCHAAGLLLMLDLDFFAMVFLVVYVGAIAVLFLFVVMMLNIKIEEVYETALPYLPLGGLIGLIFVTEILLVVERDFIPMISSSSLNLQYIQFLPETSSTIQAIGELIYTYYFFYFIVASLILLIAMIGAIVLTMYKGAGVKRQEVFFQNARECTKTIQKYRQVNA